MNYDSFWYRHYYESVNGGEPACIDEQIPFDIPDTWEWVRLSHIVYNHGQEKPESDFSYIDIGSIDNKRQKLNQTENIICADKAPSRARKIVHWGDILYSTVRPYLHNMCIVDKAFSKTPIASTGFAVLCPFSGIYNAYLFYYLMSPEFDSYANDTENAKGVAYPAINDDRLYRALIPIPPSVEQQRIVARFENILPEIYQYDELSIKSKSLEKGFPDVLKKSILQHAIQGKLVPQDSNDEPASVLLERIAEERTKLGKKAAKSMSRIERRDRGTYEIFPDGSEADISDEIPFDLPTSWEWARLGSLCSKIGAGSTPKGGRAVYKSKGVLFLRSQNVYNDGLRLSNVAFIDESIDAAMSGSRVEPFDLLLNITGASIGRCAIVPEGIQRANINQHVLILRCIERAMLEYVHTCIISPLVFKNIMDMQVGATKEGLSAQKAALLLIPIPPVKEQHRIITALRSLPI